MRPAKRPAHPAGAPATGYSGLLAAIVITIAVGLAYYNTLRAPFIFDDGPGIELNQSIHQLSALQTVLHPPVDTGSAVAGRPVVNLTLAVNYAISGLNPWSYHAANILIHALAALTLFGLVRAALESPVLRAQWAGKSILTAFAIALLWALHPLQTESVTCVIQRTESLVGLFYLFTLYAFARAAAAVSPASRLTWTVLSVAACTLGMATKEVMVTAPVVALLYDRTFVSGSFRGIWRQRWLHYGLVATWALLFYLLQGDPIRGGTAGYASVTGWQYLLTQCRAIVLYLQLAVWPHPLVLDYGTWVASDLEEVWPQALLLVAFAGATVWALWRRPVLGFLGAWFFIILSPSSSVVPLVTQTIAEHRVYLPLAALIALGIGFLAARSARLVLPVTAAAALLFGALTLSRNQLYRSPAELWRDNLAREPDNIRVFAGLAGVADKAGDFTQAAACYEDYLRRKPDDAEMRFNFAKDLVKVGRRAEALQSFEEVLRARPADADVRVNYGTCLLVLGRNAEAVAQFETVLRLRGGGADNHFNLAEALLKADRLPEALAHYRQAATLKPATYFMQQRYGDALLKAGHPAAAADAYRAAVALKPDLFAAWTNLGGALMMLGRSTEAVRAYDAALRLKPNDPAARQNLDYARRPRPH